MYLKEDELNLIKNVFKQSKNTENLFTELEKATTEDEIIFSLDNYFSDNILTEEDKHIREVSGIRVKVIKESTEGLVGYIFYNKNDGYDWVRNSHGSLTIKTKEDLEKDKKFLLKNLAELGTFEDIYFGEDSFKSINRLEYLTNEHKRKKYFIRDIMDATDEEIKQLIKEDKLTKEQEEDLIWAKRFHRELKSPTGNCEGLIDMSGYDEILEEFDEDCNHLLYCEKEHTEECIKCGGKGLSLPY